MNLKYKFLFVGAVLFLQGCVAPNSGINSKSAIEHLIIAEPVAISYKSEIALARLTDVIQRAEITDAQRAQLYYDRGVIYDSIGLRSLSRLDFNRALRLKPNLVDAYNFLGIQFTQLQEFIQAYDSFDSALELAPEHEYAYLNRGIALYYGGRPNLAIKDFQTFHQSQEDDPYRLLWLYLAEFDIDPAKANINLKKRSTRVNDTTWAKKVIYLYLGELEQAEFIDMLMLNINSNKELSDRLCEAYFYLGKFNQMKGNNTLAANFFKLALSTNVYEFVEHRYAKLELDLMRKVPAVNTVE